jgi:hypothetical protein
VWGHFFSLSHFEEEHQLQSRKPPPLLKLHAIQEASTMSKPNKRREADVMKLCVLISRLSSTRKALGSIRVPRISTNLVVVEWLRVA